MSIFWLIVVVIASLLLGWLFGTIMFAWALCLCNDKKYFSFMNTLLITRLRIRTGMSDKEIKEKLSEKEK